MLYEINPLDTLFFRGSTPMEAGQNVVVSLFPPPVSVFEGTLRTAVLQQQNIDFNDYTSGKNNSLNEFIGNPGEKPPFEVTCIMIKRENKFFVPVPATWFLDSESKPKQRNDYFSKKIIVAKNYQKEFEKLSVMSSEEKLPYIRAEKNAQPLGSIWISVDFINSSSNEFGKDDFLLQSEILSFEHRTGIALDANKHTVEGQLYSSTHIRLLPDVSMVVGISKDIKLNETGKLYLGGEKRICYYKRITENILDSLYKKISDQYFSLVPIKATEENLECLVASAKLTTTAGWDLAKGFHKSTTNWIPAGAVFNKKINNSCVAITQTK